MLKQLLDVKDAHVVVVVSKYNKVGMLRQFLELDYKAAKRFENGASLRVVVVASEDDIFNLAGLQCTNMLVDWDCPYSARTDGFLRSRVRSTRFKGEMTFSYFKAVDDLF